MYIKILKDYIENKIKKQEDPGTTQGKVSIHLPVHVTLVNIILYDLISSSNGLKDFNVIELSNLHHNEFTVKIDHKKITKTLRCRIKDVGYNNFSEALIIIEFLEGLRFYEKMAIKSALAFQRGWQRLKIKLQDSSEAETASESIIDFNSNGIVINVTQAIRNQDLDLFNSVLKFGDVSTEDNQLIIDFNLGL